MSKKKTATIYKKSISALWTRQETFQWGTAKEVPFNVDTCRLAKSPNHIKFHWN